MIYALLSGGLKPIDYLLIAVMAGVALLIAGVIVWRKIKGKSSCGCDGCSSSSACGGNCSSCNACSSKKKENEQDKHENK